MFSKKKKLQVDTNLTVLVDVDKPKKKKSRYDKDKKKDTKEECYIDEMDEETRQTFADLVKSNKMNVLGADPNLGNLFFISKVTTPMQHGESKVDFQTRVHDSQVRFTRKERKHILKKTPFGIDLFLKK